MTARLETFAVALGVLALGASARAAQGDKYTIHVGPRTLALDAAEWRPMANPKTFAENFEATGVKAGEAWGQVLTIFKLPMSSDRKRGVQLTKSEFVEPFVAHPDMVTVEIKVDRGQYWVLIRQTFTLTAETAKRVEWDVDGHAPRPTNSVREQRSLVRTFQDQIDATRSWINVNL